MDVRPKHNEKKKSCTDQAKENKGANDFLKSRKDTAYNIVPGHRTIRFTSWEVYLDSRAVDLA